jgi:ABC-type dipeptide/oligopeptide/nickel transport system ATPase component
MSKIAGLTIASDLTLPIDAVTQKFAILGTSGSGKSFTAMKLAELMLDAGAQIVAIDPVGIWWSLRLAANGKSVGYEQVRVFGGDHGDLPLTKESGALVGRLLAERRFSAVLDVSQFTTGEMKLFLTEFAEQFFQSKKSHKSPVHLFLEECQTYIPQDKSEREDPKMLNRWERLIKFFRNYGGGTSMISQQPQSVNKKCLNLADTLFAMRTIGSHERKAILSWVKDVVESESDLVANLPKLPTGTAHIWSPSWLKISRDIDILPKRTFDAGKTPEMGVDAVEPKPLTRVDVEQLRTEMAEMIEKVKADDPKELRAQLAQLKRELAKRPTEVKQVIEEKIVEIPVLRPEQIQELADAIKEVQQVATVITNALAAVRKAPPIVTNRPRPSLPAPRPQVTRPQRQQQAASNGDLNASKVKILSRLVELLECTGKDAVSKEQLAAWSEYSPNSGGYNNYLGSLRSAGLIEYPSGGQVTITVVGRMHAHPGDAPVDSDEMLERAKRVLGGSEARILETLHASYPEITGKVELAEAVGFSANSGGFNNYLGHMRTLGFIEYPQPGKVRCSDWLFL